MSRNIILSIGGVVAIAKRPVGIALAILILTFCYKAPDSENYTVIDIDDTLTFNINNGREQHQIKVECFAIAYLCSTKFN